jgi:uncharacterized membrane protein
MQILSLFPQRVSKPIVIQPISGQGLGALVILTLLGLAMTIIRGFLTNNWWMFDMLSWNVALAWFPLGTVLVLRDLLTTRAVGLWVAVPFLLLWLSFLPNAPYIITDLFHIQNIQSPLLWFDTMTIFLFAMTGLLTGLYSTVLVHRLVIQRLGVLLAWAAMLVCQGLSGFGIFLGRWVRLNSWDLVTTPRILARAIYDALHNPLSMKLTLTYGFVLAGLYVAFYVFLEGGARAVDGARD